MTTPLLPYLVTARKPPPGLDAELVGPPEDAPDGSWKTVYPPPDAPDGTWKTVCPYPTTVWPLRIREGLDVVPISHPRLEWWWPASSVKDPVTGHERVYPGRRARISTGSPYVAEEVDPAWEGAIPGFGGCAAWVSSLPLVRSVGLLGRDSALFDEAERVTRYKSLRPFNWFAGVSDSDEAESGEDLFRRFYEDILVDGAKDALCVYFDADAGDDTTGNGTASKPFRSLWFLRVLLLLPMSRNLVCHLKRGCTWTWGGEAAASPTAEALLRVWTMAFGWTPLMGPALPDAIGAAILEFNGGRGDSFLHAGEGRTNVTICAWNEEDDADLPQPVLDGSDGGEGATGLYLSPGHERIFVSEVAFTRFGTCIMVEQGARDLFYRLTFDDTVAHYGICVGARSGTYDLWTGALAGTDTDHAFADYSTARGTYSEQILIGFCTFTDVGNNERANVIAAINLDICTTEVCVDHCVFERCSDGVLLSYASSGNLVIGNQFVDGADPVDSGDGNGVDMKGVLPRTESAWVDETGNPADPDQVEPLKSAIFDNVFLRMPAAIVIHYGCRYLDIFNNRFLQGIRGAIGVGTDHVQVVFVEDALASLGGSLPAGLSTTAVAGATTEPLKRFDCLVRGDLGCSLQTGNVRIYRNIIDHTDSYLRTDTGNDLVYWQGAAGIGVSMDDAQVLCTGTWIGAGLMDFWVVSNTIVDCSGPAVLMGRSRNGDCAAGTLEDVGIFSNAFSNNGTAYEGLVSAWDLAGNPADATLEEGYANLTISLVDLAWGSSAVDAWSSKVVMDRNVYHVLAFVFSHPAVTSDPAPFPEMYAYRPIVGRYPPRDRLSMSEVRDQLWEVGGAYYAERSIPDDVVYPLAPLFMGGLVSILKYLPDPDSVLAGSGTYAVPTWNACPGESFKTMHHFLRGGLRRPSIPADIDASYRSAGEDFDVGALECLSTDSM